MMLTDICTLRLPRVDLLQILDALQLRREYWQAVSSCDPASGCDTDSGGQTDEGEALEIVKHYSDIIKEIRIQLAA